MNQSLTKSPKKRRLPLRAQTHHAIEYLEARRLLSTVFWMSATDGDFNTPGNWSTGVVPGPTDDAVISMPQVTVTVASGDSISVNSLTTNTPIDFTGGNVTIAAGFTINNTTVTIGTAGAASTLTFMGSQTLGGSAGNITFVPTGVGGGNQFDVAEATGSGATLTIGSGLTIDGGGGTITTEDTGDSIVSAATIDADSSVGAEALTVTGMTSGTGTVTNTGTWEATDGELDLGGNWTNSGNLSVSGTSTLGLGGVFSVSSLGSFSPTPGAIINLTGQLNNNGQTLALAPPTTGSWNLLGGTIIGGTVTSTGGATLVCPPASVPALSTLIGVTLGAGSPLTVPNDSFESITGGLTLSGTTVTIGTSAELEFVGTQTLGGTGTVTFSANASGEIDLNPVTDVPVTMTIASGITIDGADGNLVVESGGSSFVNDGTISSTVAGGNIAIEPNGASFVNDGTISADVAGADITIGPAPTPFANDGTIGTSNGGVFAVEGDFTNDAVGFVDIGIGSSGGGNIDVMGMANLGGTLNVSLVNGFVPPQNQTYIALMYGGSTGAFATETGLTIGAVVLMPVMNVTTLDLMVTSGGSAPPDLLFSVQPTLTQTGDMVSASFTEANSGVGAAGPYLIAMGLSADSIFGDADDIVIATSPQSGLALGATQAITLNATIPATVPAGNYYLFIQLDSTDALNELNPQDGIFMTETPSITVAAAAPPPPATIGGLDPTFGTGGLAAHDVGLSSTADILEQSNGQSIIVGTSGIFPNEEFGLTRYNTDGSVDTTFGTSGSVQTALGGDDQASAAFLLPDGDILVAGTATTISNGQSTGSQFALAEYTSSGALDTNFGGGTGMVLTSFSAVAGTLSNDLANALIVSSSGEIFVGGSSDAGGHGLDFAVAAFNSNGTPAAGFGKAGQVLLDFSGGNDSIQTLALQPKGSLLAVGYTTNPGTGVQSVALARFLSTGALDPHFATKGKAVTSVSGVADAGSSVAITSKGLIIVGGYTATGSAAAGTLSSNFLLLEYTVAGKLDHSFGHGGIETTSFGQPAAISSVVLEAGGFIAASGKTTPNLGSIDPTQLQLALASYTPSGLPNTSFNGTGQSIINLASGAVSESLTPLGGNPRQPALIPAGVVAPLDSTSALMQEFNELTQSDENTLATTPGGQLADAGTDANNTVEAVVIQNGIDLAAVAASTLPASVLGGAKGTLSIQISEVGDLIAAGGVTVQLFTSTTSQVATGAQPFDSVAERINLKEGRAKKFQIRFLYPSSLASASYTVLATVATSLNDINSTNNTASLGSVTIGAPSKDLTGSGLVAPVFSGAKPATVHFIITDAGNVPIVGSTSVEFFASTGMTVAGATPLATLSLPVNLKPSASHSISDKLALPATLEPGNYYLLALLDPNNVLGDPNTSNNLLVSGNMFT